MKEKEFITIISDAVEEIKDKGHEYLKSLSDVDFEEVIYSTLLKKGLETLHYKKGSSAFPDITCGHFGIEIKTTQKNGWTTLGGSIMEGTKKADVEIIYIIFLKKGGIPDIKIRKYEECLSNIKVTHSPRYEINMLCDNQDSIFAKLRIPYQSFSSSNNKVKLLRKYYKEKLKGAYPWWLEEDSDKTSDIAIKEFSSLSKKEQVKIEVELVALHPEMIGSEYAAASIYLLTKHNLFDKSMRDRFTAGGRSTYTINGHSYNCSRIAFWLKDHWDAVQDYLLCNQELYCIINGLEHCDDIIEKWIDSASLAFENSRNIVQLNNTDINLSRYLKLITQEPQ
jgi:hypothetical protein